MKEGILEATVEDRFSRAEHTKLQQLTPYDLEHMTDGSDIDISGALEQRRSRVAWPGRTPEAVSSQQQVGSGLEGISDDDPF